MIDFLLLLLEQPTMLHESRASDTVINDSVAEIPRFLNVYTCANNNRDFKIVHDGRLGRLDKCHVTPNPRDS